MLLAGCDFGRLTRKKIRCWRLAKISLGHLKGSNRMNSYAFLIMEFLRAPNKTKSIWFIIIMKFMSYKIKFYSKAAEVSLPQTFCWASLEIFSGVGNTCAWQVSVHFRQWRGELWGLGGGGGAVWRNYTLRVDLDLLLLYLKVHPTATKSKARFEFLFFKGGTKCLFLLVILSRQWISSVPLFWQW